MKPNNADSIHNSDQSTFAAFNQDVQKNAGYLYTTKSRLSSRIANRRLSDVTLAMTRWKNSNVIDIGCGDGTYTIELFERGKLHDIRGVDPAEEAIALASEKVEGQPRINFETQDAYHLPYADNSFEIAHLRGILHHVEDPEAVLREALRIAPTIVVIEPNGFNPVLKLIEKLSPYHKEHQEKSYSPAMLDQWCSALGATVVKRKYAGLVPFFCPDVFAIMLKYFEPLIERLPVNRICCAVYVFTATRKK